MTIGGDLWLVLSPPCCMWSQGCDLEEQVVEKHWLTLMENGQFCWRHAYVC